jgi:hypothetical protein
LVPANLVSNGLVNAALVSLLALHWHPCPHCAGGITSTCAVIFTATASLAWASLPSSRWTHHPHVTRVVVSIANWRPPHHDAILTPQRTWRCHCVIVVVCGICCRNRRRSLATWLLCPANLALVILRALHRRHCPGCAVVFASIALSMPALCWRCHQRCPGRFVLIALALLPSLQTSNCPPKTQSRHIGVCGVVVLATLGTPALLPTSQTGICPVMTQLQRVVGKVSLLHSTLSPVAFSLYLESAHSDFCLRWSGQGSNGVLSALSRCSCSHCTGVIASVKLFSLLALRRRCCQVALQGPAGAVQAFAGVALAFCPHPAGVIASIVLLSMSPALCRHHRHVAGRFCPCRAGIFVLIAFALPPALQPCVCPDTKQSQHVLASLPAPRHRCCRQLSALLPLSHGRFCPCSAGVANFGIPTLRPGYKLAAAQSWRSRNLCLGGIIVALIVAQRPLRLGATLVLWFPSLRSCRHQSHPHLLCHAWRRWLVGGVHGIFGSVLSRGFLVQLTGVRRPCKTGRASVLARSGVLAG